MLVIRGDLLKKYPTAVIYAQQGKWKVEQAIAPMRVLDDSNPAQLIKTPMFKAEIEPDVRFLGFDLTASVVKGNPDPCSQQSRLVLRDSGAAGRAAIRARQPQRGFADDADQRGTSWPGSIWRRLRALGCVDFDVNVPDDTGITSAPDSQFEWGRNAADMAYILYQVPVMVASTPRTCCLEVSAP